MTPVIHTLSRIAPLPKSQRYRWPVFVASACLVVLIGWYDQVTPYVIRFDAAYFAVVALAAWFTGRAPAAGVAALAVTFGIYPDIFRFPNASLATIVWNGAGILVVYLGAIEILGGVRSRLVDERRAARTDPLTDLPNRLALDDALGAEVERARRYEKEFAFAYVDLDGFKQLNDRHGHAAGDQALRLVGRAIIGQLRTTDLVSRVGGDEFAVLLPETDIEGARALMERVLTAIETDLGRDGFHGVTASVGIQAVGEGAPDPDEVIRRADDLMYEAKRGGKARVVVGEPLGGAPAFDLAEQRRRAGD